ncbi:ubiquitin conjugating enzyme family protein [Trichuris trichiura]|uniref:Ubiquitin conjugating enzyme family protein n=1 Tax=Trichuris trichiura TaxID=36087 RepID=A0A077Z7W7_TRITR|nr:ubiquitin conjugating enzyme family protein [Trichuris trichiura]
MGTSVSLASSPEQHDGSPVERAKEILRQNPLKTSSMVRLERIINEADSGEKLQLLNGGIVRRIIELISTLHNSWSAAKLESPMNGSNINFAKVPLAASRCRNHGFVTQITVGRRKANAMALSRGIGYSCGSTRCQWDIERYIEETIVREEQLAWLMNALAAFLYSSSGDFSHPETVFEKLGQLELNHVVDEISNILQQSTIHSMITYHLKNQSIYDISERLDFYQALLNMVCCIVIHPGLMNYVLRPDGPPEESLLLRLLPNFRSLIVSYLAFTRLKLRTPDLRLTEFLEMVDSCQRLMNACNKRYVGLTAKTIATTPYMDVNSTISAKKKTSRPLCDESEPQANEITTDSDAQPITPLSPASVYYRAMKSLQIRSWRFIDENGKLLLPYSYYKEAKALNPLSPSLKDRGKRIAREIASLENNLPLSESNSIFVCVEESRCDIMKVLITGPDQTPYQNGCFEFDLFFPVGYPFTPPKMTFLTTNGGELRFNPNLYQDGKVCLSILNTWEGRPEEKWNPYCSLLQLLVSIQALIFVKEPYFNEPGFEKYMCTERGQHLSRNYNQQLRHATLQVAVLEQLRNAGDYFQDVVYQHVWLKRDSIVQQAQKCMNEAMLVKTTSNKGEDRKLLYASDSEALSLNVVAQTVESVNRELCKLEKWIAKRKDPLLSKTIAS